MLTLSVIGVERGAVIAVAPDGERFLLPVDASVLARLHEAAKVPEQPRMSPREIQAHVRAGMSSEEVAALTGVPVASIERFVGPVLAERAHIVDSALAVRLPPETEGSRSRTFGAVMGDRLAALAATGIRWTSAKSPSGWVLAVGFVADDVQHDARWHFDPKRMQLDPQNVEASTLSQRGTPAALTPRLRAIEPTAPVTVVPTMPAGVAVAPAPVAVAAPDRSRFDSAIFRFPDLTPEVGQRRPAARIADAAKPQEVRGGPTTDQLASLARRRGQRESVDTASMPVTRALDIAETNRRDESGDVFAPRPVADRAAPGSVTQGRFGARPTPTPSPAPGPSPVPTAVDSRRPTAAPTAPAAPQASRPASAPATPRHAPPTPSAPPAEDRSTQALPELRRPRGRRFERRDEDANVTETLPRPQDDAQPDRPTPGVRPRRGRTSMPSWDEIVFGRDEH